MPIINMPLIEFINLSIYIHYQGGNNISSIRPFRKCGMPRLENLHLSKKFNNKDVNKVTQWSTLTEMRFSNNAAIFTHINFRVSNFR